MIRIEASWRDALQILGGIVVGGVQVEGLIRLWSVWLPEQTLLIHNTFALAMFMIGIFFVTAVMVSIGLVCAASCIGSIVSISVKTYRRSHPKEYETF
jgi:hypothetical protein